MKVNSYPAMLQEAAKFCSGLTSGGACSVIGLNDGGPGHTVATARWKGKFFFMDPNGRVVIFDRGRYFREWFVNEFPNADEDNYDKLWWIEVENYQVGASAV